MRIRVGTRAGAYREDCTFAVHGQATGSTGKAMLPEVVLTQRAPSAGRGRSLVPALDLCVETVMNVPQARAMITALEEGIESAERVAKPKRRARAIE